MDNLAIKWLSLMNLLRHKKNEGFSDTLGASDKII